MTAPVLRGPLVSESFARFVLSARGGRHAGGSSDEAAAFAAYGRWWRRHLARHGPASVPRALHESTGAALLGLLGYQRIPHTETARPRQVTGLMAAGSSRVAVLTTGWNADLDQHWREAVVAGTRGQVEWCVAFNGLALRIVDAGRPFARRHVEVDLASASQSAAAFALLWLIARSGCLASAQGGTPLARLATASARQQALVCSALDRGVRDAFTRVASAFAESSPLHAIGEPAPRDQALTVVFRLLFLLYVESRGLSPLHHTVFRDGYSLQALSSTPVGRTRGLWPAMRAAMRLAHSGCRVRGLEVTAFNGRLFSPDHAPLAERARLDDGTARAVLSSVSSHQDRDGTRRPVPYSELGVEQLGAIYERLMDADAPAARSRSGRDAAVAPRTRKATGSFYTPRSLTDFLVRRTLAPLVSHCRAEDVLRLRVLDPAMGSGAFLVSACRYLAAAYERALVRDGAYRDSDFTAGDRAEFRRLVAQRCLYGVDLNPMAVQLARLSLWLATLATGRPLSFLDHRLRVGDSLVGASVADLARQPPGSGSHRRRPDALPLLAATDMLQPLGRCVGLREQLALTPDDDVDVVREKERSMRVLDGERGPLAGWRLAADTWCSAWFWPGPAVPGPGVFGDLLAFALGGTPSLRRSQLDGFVGCVREAAARQRFFHWSLEFPEVFVDDEGRGRPDAGFDAVIGNPPWDMIRAEDGASPERVRQTLGFVRACGLYTRGGEAHVNRFHLFVERALDLLRPGGRLGLITPWGLYGDSGAASVRRRLLERARLDAVVALANRRAIFPIHRSITFAVSTATRGPATSSFAVRPGEVDVTRLDTIPDGGVSVHDFPVAITHAAVTRLSPGDLACPAVGSPRALACLLAIAERFPAAADPQGWGLRFGRELNATDDRRWFRRGGPGYPVVEGKHVHPFRVVADEEGLVVPEAAAGALRLPERAGHDRVAYRDVASGTNRLTLIAAVLPAGYVSTHTVFVSKCPLDADAAQVVCALLNSLVANWYVRHWVGTHVTASLVHRLPLPRPHPETPAFAALSSLARRCAVEGASGESYVRLQVECARLYRLDATDLGEILATFPLMEEAMRQEIHAAFSTGIPGERDASTTGTRSESASSTDEATTEGGRRRKRPRA